jgi:peptidoglycan hydrolase-like protein with peptidoglycan-binding domain
MDYHNSGNDREGFRRGFTRGRDPSSKLRPAIEAGWNKVKTLVRDYASFWDQVLAESGGREPTEDDLGSAVSKIVQQRRDPDRQAQRPNQGTPAERGGVDQMGLISELRTDPGQRDDLTAHERKQAESGRASIGMREAIVEQVERGNVGTPRSNDRQQVEMAERLGAAQGSYRFEDGNSPREKQSGLAAVQRMLFSIDGGKYLPQGEDPAGDGYFGPNTRKALQQFLHDYGVRGDGSEITPGIANVIRRAAG